MDLRVYYQKIRDLEAQIDGPSAVIISRATPDGGKAGTMADVPRLAAARLVADEKADLASVEIAAQFRAEVEASWRAAHEPPGLADAEIRALRTVFKLGKKP